MSILIQTVNPAVSTGSITATLSATATGSLILVFVGSSALTDTVSTVTDNAGNTYAKSYGIAGGSGGDTECWYASNCASTTSVVVTFSGSASTKSVFVREYSGPSIHPVPLDIIQTASGSGTSVDTGSANPASTADYILTVCSCSCLGVNPTLLPIQPFINFVSQTLIAGTAIHAIQERQRPGNGSNGSGQMQAGGTSPVWDVGAGSFVVINNVLNNYSFARAGNGMSVSEKIK